MSIVYYATRRQWLDQEGRWQHILLVARTKLPESIRAEVQILRHFKVDANTGELFLDLAQFS